MAPGLPTHHAAIGSNAGAPRTMSAQVWQPGCAAGHRRPTRSCWLEPPLPLGQEPGLATLLDWAALWAPSRLPLRGSGISPSPDPPGTTEKAWRKKNQIDGYFSEGLKPPTRQGLLYCLCGTITMQTMRKISKDSSSKKPMVHGRSGPSHQCHLTLLLTL